MLASSPLNSDGTAEAAPHRPDGATRLTEPGRAFRAAGGPVDVFALALDGAAQPGRLPLFRVEEGEALFGLGEAAAVCLAAVPAAGARLEAMSAPDAPAIDGWVARLMHAVDAPSPPQVTAIAAPGIWALTPERAARPATGVVWAWMVSGEASILGWFAVPGAGAPPLPLTPRAFVTAAAPATMQTVATAALLAGDAGADALARLFSTLGAHVLPRIAARMKTVYASERTRLAARQSASRTLWERAQARLGNALGEDAPIAQASAWDNDAVFRAVAVLADDARTRAMAPATEGAPPPAVKDRLDAIGRASRFRVRPVELSGRWWEGEVLPCIALMEGGDEGRTGRRPVAILPRVWGSAVVIDPAANTSTPLDAATARQISSGAFALNWLLPGGRLNASGMLAFGLRGKRGMLVTVILAAIAGALLGLVMPVITGTIVGRVIPNAEHGQLGQLLALLAGAAVAGFCFALVRMLTLLRLQGLVDGGLQCALWDRLLAMPAPFFGRMASGDLANRALGINWISTALGGPLLGAIVAGLASVLSLAIMAYYSWRLTLVAMVLVVAALICAALIIRSMIAAQRELFRTQGKLIGAELQLLTAAPKFQVACATPRAFATWAELFAKVTRASFRSALPQCQTAILAQVFQPLATLAMLFMIVFVAESISTPDFVAFNAAFGQFLGMVMGLISALVTAAVVVPLYERAQPILETEPEDATGKVDPGALSGAIALRDIRFRYAAEGHPVLDGLNLDIRAGEYVAIVGPSGAGKSTLLRLMLGFERPELGEISFDGKALDDLDPHLLRQQIGVVMQMGRLTPASIFDNIVNHGRHTLDEAWEAAEQAGLAESIRRMPMGMQTYISEGSATISGGERQRVMIARAFVRKARILLFDEATSALDNETQAIVTGTLGRLTCTRIVIAHRLSTIEGADRIIVLGHGKVAEEGSFRELMERRGEFYALAKRQMV